MSYHQLEVPLALITTYIAMEIVMFARGDTDISPLFWLVKRIVKFKSKPNNKQNHT